jgi:pimeloyl-ACP methyl ester carboxylesterase
MSRLLRVGCLIVLALPLPARAQAERFELGQRLRAFEGAWDEHPDPAARQRTVAPLKRAVTAFFAFRLPDAGSALDEARRALASDRPAGPEQRWAESLYAKPESRLLDPAQGELPVTLEAFYPVEATPARPATLTLKLLDADNKAVASLPATPVTKLPQALKLTVRGVSEGDYRLRADVLLQDQVVASSEQTLSLVSRLGKRLERLSKAAEALPKEPLTTEKETLRSLTHLLGTLAQKQTPETNYPAAHLLAEAEGALPGAGGDRPAFGGKRPGQFWLTLAARKSAVPVRLLAPEAVTKGEPLPLVIALHGAGGSENLFFDGYGRGAIVPLCRERGWLLVAPRYAGFSRSASLPDLIEAVARLYPVDAKRVFVVGHSMGAALAVTAVQEAPERVAAVAALGGAGMLRKAEAVANVPFFLGLGAQDDLARRNVPPFHEALKGAGVQKLVYREYPDVEHLAIVQVALKDVFLFFDAASERMAIQAVLERQIAAWNRGDLEGFMATYWKSPELTFFSGKDEQAGWQATLERYRKRYQGEGREMGTLAFSALRIAVIDADHAWVRGRWQLTMSKETLGGLFTLILRRLPEGWRIVHDHTSG